MDKKNFDDEKIIKFRKSKVKRINAFGMLKGSPKYKEEKDNHKEF